MHLTTLLTALTATTLAFAQSDLAQYGAAGDATSAMTTWTLTRTVERVVQTVTATRNGTEMPITTTSVVGLGAATPSLTLTPYHNGTASVWGTGASSGLGAPAWTGMPISGAEKVGSAGALVAVVGAIGLVIL